MFKSTDYVMHIKEQPFCCSCMKTKPVDPHHVINIGMGGNRKKESVKHFSCIPLCRKCHREYHDLGKKRWEEKNDLNAFELVHYYFSNFVYTHINRDIQ